MVIIVSIIQATPENASETSLLGHTVALAVAVSNKSIKNTAVITEILVLIV